jgi:flagellar hook-basal body complex protein FliE
MSNMDINQVLGQMRILRDQARGTALPQDTGMDFASLLQESLGKVNENQQQAHMLETAFEIGKADVSLADVMIAQQKASVSFQAVVQTRNKLVEAYRDVMNMPI